MREESAKNKDNEKTEKLTVAVRVRPIMDVERQKGQNVITRVLDDKIVTLESPETGKDDHLRQNRIENNYKEFLYDVACGPESTQKIVYERTTESLVRDVLDGYNATVFAYGATGSGKTYTMVGTQDEPGVMVRALNDLFKATESSEDKKYEISMSYLEIYNENIRDLLKPGSGTLELRENASTGVIKVHNLSEVSTLNTEEVMKLLTKGNKQRTCEPTAANKTSSRSHALLLVNVKHTTINSSGDKVAATGKLYMIDLAGSERAKRTKNQGKRLQEGAHINRSLLALGNCINALAEGKTKYVNYRDSKLTRLLKDALSGNFRTVMIAHVAPVDKQRDEVRNTLIYAGRAKNISNKVDRNVAGVSYHVSQYKTIINELKDEVSRLTSKLNHVGATPTENDSNETEEQKQKTETLKQLKSQLIELFREQMSLRSKLMDIDNNVLALSMEFERQNLVVTEWETERARRKSRIESEKNKKGPDGEQIIDMDTDKEKDEDSEDEEPEEVQQAWEDLMYLQKEQQRYTEMRSKVEEEMFDAKSKAKELEELLLERSTYQKKIKEMENLQTKTIQALPDKITTDEQRELITLLCKVHELEIEKVEMESDALLKMHEIRRRDLLLLKLDRQKTLSEEIILRQRQIIECEGGTALPQELQELYALYQMELQYGNQEKGHGNNLKSPSMISLRAPSMDRLPPIKGEPEKLFDRPQRRHSFGDERRPSSDYISLRSPTSSASSAPATAPESRTFILPPIPGAMSQLSSDFDLHEMKYGVRNINQLAARRKFSQKPLIREHFVSMDDLPNQYYPYTSNNFRRRIFQPERSRRGIYQQQLEHIPRRPYPGSSSSSDAESPIRNPKYHRTDIFGLRPIGIRGANNSISTNNRYVLPDRKMHDLTVQNQDIILNYGLPLPD